MLMLTLVCLMLLTLIGVFVADADVDIGVFVVYADVDIRVFVVYRC